MIKILQGDCRELLKTLPAGSVNCCVTSPPYYNLRDYNVAGQIGQEKTVAEYLEQMVSVFSEVRRVLREDGTLWLNLGDSYSSGGRGGNWVGDEHAQRKQKWHNPPDGLKRKELIGIPWRVAFALQADGWYLRQDIIWAKPNPMPESVTDRCTKAHEYVFLMSKNERYYFDQEEIAEPSTGWHGSRFHTGKTDEHQLGRAQKTRPSAPKGSFNGKTEAMADTGQNAFRAVTETRNKRSVWTVPTQSYSGAHFATFPPELILPMILAGCPVGGVVLDPFGGSGTTGEVASGNGRNALLMELNPDYVKLCRDRGGLFLEKTEA